MRLNPDQRLAAAVLYLLSAIFQFGILVVLFDLGRSNGLQYLFSDESPAQATVVYLIAAGTISLVVMATLLLNRNASKSTKISLVTLAVAQLLGGLAYAQITVITGVIAFCFLVAYSRARDA